MGWEMKKIIWKDILKPRYAIVFEVEKFPTPPKEKGWKWEDRFYAVVKDRPYKRPLTMSFNQFYGELSKRGNVVSGYYWVLRLLHGIGSTNRRNMNNPIVMGVKEEDEIIYDTNTIG